LTEQNSNKRIAIITRQFPTPSETFVVHQVIDAIELGYDVGIFVKEKGELSESTQREEIEQYHLMEKTVVLEDYRPSNDFFSYWKAFQLLFKGVPLNFYKTFNPLVYGTLGLKGVLFYGLLRLRSALDYDIYHIQFGTNSFPLPQLKEFGLLKGNLVATFHGIDAHFTEQSLNEKKRSYALLFKNSKRITVNTKYLGDKVKKLGCLEEKIEVVHMGVDTQYFTPLKKTRKALSFHLISVGRLLPIKGHKWGIKAVSLLKKWGYKVKYSIVGEGNEYENLKNLVSTLKLEKEVFLLGQRNQNEVKELLQKADAFLMTSSVDGQGRREAQGVVTLEAQACGLPVVAFRSGGIPFTLEENETGFLSDEEDFEDMARNIEKMMLNDGLLEEMSSKARLFVEKMFSNEKNKAQMATIYNELLIEE
jgi:colanic acid/amylovoran biosynthesis glycosyltransferase